MTQSVVVWYHVYISGAVPAGRCVVCQIFRADGQEELVF